MGTCADPAAFVVASTATADRPWIASFWFSTETSAGPHGVATTSMETRIVEDGGPLTSMVELFEVIHHSSPGAASLSAGPKPDPGFTWAADSGEALGIDVGLSEDEEEQAVRVATRAIAIAAPTIPLDILVLALGALGRGSLCRT